MRSPARRAALVAGLLASLLPAAGAAAQCQVQKIDGDPEIDDDAGRSVAIAGDVLVIGNPKLTNVQGKAEVYRRTGDAWVLEAVLQSGVVNCVNAFGRSVATNGDVIVVGDPAETAQVCPSGAVYVYRHDGADWQLEAHLAASDSGFNHGFGLSVALWHDIILVGAPFAYSEVGAAYVFSYDGSDWTQEAVLPNVGGVQGDVFGSSVAVRDAIVVVGAHGGTPVTGAAFVFGSIGDDWVLLQELAPFNTPAAQIWFGYSLALAGDTAIIGAPNGGSGAAYTFTFDGAQWLNGAKLVPSAPVGIGPFFGRSVAFVDDTTLLVTSSGDSADGFEAGAAYLFHRQGDDWVEVSKFNGDDTNASDLFGVSVAASGDTAVVGAVGNNGPGAAYVFAGVSTADCNANRVPDACDILDGTSPDRDGDGVPDECRPAPDVNGDGVVDALDLAALILAWGACADPCPPCPADTNGDCAVDVTDLVIVILDWG
jgi:hypothetical protein